MVHKHTISDWLGQDVFVGLDVHKRSWIVAIMTEQADFKTFAQPPDVTLLVSYLQRHFPNATYHCVGESSSGDERTLTGITERKNRYLRWILTESAWVAIRNDESLALAFNTLCRRMPKNQAIVRIARKILNRVRFVLKHQQPCVYLHAA